MMRTLRVTRVVPPEALVAVIVSGETTLRWAFSALRSGFSMLFGSRSFNFALPAGCRLPRVDTS